eukprot:TRINITY_DN6922_c0_g1_i1.p1 TRINITY_DN6922_c0_g1~~TRINITY_DN6922_c0_g1_i1.p1  ORF type:complete len:282 (-),score=35.21 TRINITY_DN6922_c0_g1_i1:152-997(-)
MGAAARIAGFFSWLLPSAIGGLAGEMLHRRLVFEALRGKQRKLGGHLIDPGGSQTQRWTGVQSSKYTDKLKEVQCNFLVPDKIFELGDGEAHYVYCDIHYNAWPDGSFGQFVPQLMRGEVLAANDASYGPNDTLLEDWHIQAQYVWGGGGRPVQAFVGQLIKVHAGDKVTTRMYADMSGAWVLSIAVEGGQASAIVVTVPFMGTHPQYQLPYGSRSTAGGSSVTCTKLGAWTLQITIPSEWIGLCSTEKTMNYPRLISRLSTRRHSTTASTIKSRKTVCAM